MRKLIPISLILLFVSAVALADDRIIPRGSKIFIDEIGENLDMYLKAEIVKKKIAVRIVSDPERADYILTGVAEGNEERKWHEGWLTEEKDHVTGAIQLLNREGDFVWASEAGDRSFWWGSLKRGGPRKVADRLANNLKDIVQKK